MSKQAGHASEATTDILIKGICACYGVTLTPGIPVETEQIGRTCITYIGADPYSVIARHEHQDAVTIVYVSAALLHA